MKNNDVKNKNLRLYFIKKRATYQQENRFIHKNKEIYQKNIPQKLVNLKLGDVYDNLPNDEKNQLIFDYKTFNDKNPALIAFVFPFYKNKKDAFTSFVKELTNEIFVCGYNISHFNVLDLNVLKIPSVSIFIGFLLD